MSDNQPYKNVELASKTDEICQNCGKLLRKNNRNFLSGLMSVRKDSCKCNADVNFKVVPEASESTESTLPIGICQPGDMVARHYKVIECLGSGGMSVVYKAQHMLLDKTVAIKLLLPNRIPSQKMVMRMQQEAKAISRLRHDNIVQVSEFGLDEQGLPYLVMDYVTGEPLSSVIAKRGRLTLEDSFRIAIQVASGLEHAQEEGIVHRDIKPANIIITTEKGEETAKIVDFGIAKLSDNQGPSVTQTGELFGSPLYMSPEQCKGKVADHRSDIYSLGCVLYECVFGNPPFISDSTLTTMMLHISDEPQINESVCGAPLKIVLQKCLVKDLSQRYQTAAELKADLLKAQQGIMPAKLAARIVKEQLSVKQIALIFAVFAIISGAFVSSYFSNFSKMPEPDQVTLPTPEQYRKEKWKSLGGTAEDFEKGKEPPHVVRPLGTARAGDAYAEADAIDNSTRLYFIQGEYEKAIPLLQFAVGTYKEGGRHYNNDPDIETAYLGGAHLHLGQCYVMLKKWDKALLEYRECFRLYNKVKLKLKLYEDAVSGYAGLLRQIGKTDESAKVLAEYREKGKITTLP